VILAELPIYDVYASFRSSDGLLIPPAPPFLQGLTDNTLPQNRLRGQGSVRK